MVSSGVEEVKQKDEASKYVNGLIVDLKDALGKNTVESLCKTLLKLLRLSGPAFELQSYVEPLKRLAACLEHDFIVMSPKPIFFCWLATVVRKFAHAAHEEVKDTFLTAEARNKIMGHLESADKKRKNQKQEMIKSKLKFEIIATQKAIELIEKTKEEKQAALLNFFKSLVVFGASKGENLEAGLAALMLAYEEVKARSGGGMYSQIALIHGLTPGGMRSALEFHSRSKEEKQANLRQLLDIVHQASDWEVKHAGVHALGAWAAMGDCKEAFYGYETKEKVRVLGLKDYLEFDKFNVTNNWRVRIAAAEVLMTLREEYKHRANSSLQKLFPLQIVPLVEDKKRYESYRDEISGMIDQRRIGSHREDDKKKRVESFFTYFDTYAKNLLVAIELAEGPNPAPSVPAQPLIPEEKSPSPKPAELSPKPAEPSPKPAEPSPIDATQNPEKKNAEQEAAVSRNAEIEKALEAEEYVVVRAPDIEKVKFDFFVWHQVQILDLGVANKLGWTFKTWRRRYFLLSVVQNRVYYFEYKEDHKKFLDDLKNNKKPPEIYRQINLESCIFFLADFPHNLEDPRGYKLEITSFEGDKPSRHWFIETDDPIVRKRWLKDLCQIPSATLYVPLVSRDKLPEYLGDAFNGLRSRVCVGMQGYSLLKDEEKMDAFLRIEFPETGPLLSSYENHYTLKLLPDRRIKLEQKLQIEKLPNAHTPDKRSLARYSLVIKGLNGKEVPLHFATEQQQQDWLEILVAVKNAQRSLVLLCTDETSRRFSTMAPEDPAQV